ncbi:5189_t:CDS:2 [Acaulospora colombiana]|uniref:5189_t:CDS:1 n=1 Tax=Acaulospora colombiana TaxID=27376 RepID=A0ACA9MAM4_9GLOM|nr:5189_t:CDS:2 [Acaulospora colombiana]
MVFKLFAKFTVPTILQFQSSQPSKKNNLVATLYPTLSSDATSRGAAARHSMISTSSAEEINSWSSTPDESPIPADIKEVIPMTTMSVEQELNRDAFKILQQCIDLLKMLPDEESFVSESKYVPSSTIGKHVRHICDHFRLLFDSKPMYTKKSSFENESFSTLDDNDNDSMNTLNDSSEWNVNYDNRIRNGTIETSRMAAIQQIERFQSTILDYSTVIPLNTQINMSTTAGKDPIHLQTTYGRELWFCCHHAVSI